MQRKVRHRKGRGRRCGRRPSLASGRVHGALRPDTAGPQDSRGRLSPRGPWCHRRCRSFVRASDL